MIFMPFYLEIHLIFIAVLTHVMVRLRQLCSHVLSWGRCPLAGGGGGGGPGEQRRGGGTGGPARGHTWQGLMFYSGPGAGRHLPGPGPWKRLAVRGISLLMLSPDLCPLVPLRVLFPET